MIQAAYEVFDADSGKILGAVLYYAVKDSEAGFLRAHDWGARHHPTKNIHVEEITVEQYHERLGQ
jgi:hypothetical protein